MAALGNRPSQVFYFFRVQEKNRSLRNVASEAQHRDVVAPALVRRPTLAFLALPVPASFLYEGALEPAVGASLELELLHVCRPPLSLLLLGLLLASSSLLLFLLLPYIDRPVPRLVASLPFASRAPVLLVELVARPHNL